MRLSECYSLLEVSPGATLDEIKASYRRLAFRYHPDLNPGDARAAQRFTRLNEAYVLLKKNLERPSEPEGEAEGGRRYSAETIRQEEEAKIKRGGRPYGGFSARQEEVLRDILNDPFAKQVFEDIFSKLKRGMEPGTEPAEPIRTKSLKVKWGERALNFNLGDTFSQSQNQVFADDRGHRIHPFHFFHFEDGLVVDLSVSCSPARAWHPGFIGVHGDQMEVSIAFDLFLEAFAEAKSDGKHDDDGAGSHHYPYHGQNGPGPAAQQVPGAEFQIVSLIHGASSFSLYSIMVCSLLFRFPVLV